MNRDMELIRVENLHKTYHLGEVDVPVLRGVSLSIARGEMVALMGASGSGKTTLMNILGCLDHPSSGRYWLDGKEMSVLTPNERAKVRAEKLGFVFQNFNLLARTSAIHNVAMPLDYARRTMSAKEAMHAARDLLARVGLADRMDHAPSQMSGGQQQRVAIARALITRPDLVLADEPTGNLDSHTSVEILDMFKQLNAEGITVVLVTHDPKVAAHAHRTIRIADGRIEGEEFSAPAPHFSAAGQTVAAGRAASPRRQASFGGDGTYAGGGNGDGLLPNARRPLGEKPVSATRPPMSPKRPAAATAVHRPRRHWLGALFPATFATAIGALRRNKMRSALSALGVIIAVCAVIAMTEIGQGSKAALQKTIGSMGADNLLIFPGAATSGGISWGAGSVQRLAPEDADEILRQCPAVSAVAPIVRVRTQIVYGNRNWNPGSLLGTAPSYLTVRDWEQLEEGEVFTDRDVRNRNRVCVVGQTIRRELFQEESPIGKDLRIRNVTFRVIGVLSRKGANMMGMDQDDIVLAPWTAIKYLVSGVSADSTAATAAASTGTTQVNTLDNLYPGAESPYPEQSGSDALGSPQLVRFTNVDQIIVKATGPEQVQPAIAQITELLRERHRLQPHEEDDFNVRDMAEITKAVSSTSEVVGSLLLVAAMISLVVGGVGIMNIMLVSVTERTREIGLRMAVGARSHHILRQFLVEAVVLCLFGGILGILLGRGASIVVRSVKNWPTEASLGAIVAAVAVSAAVGVVFGFYPAWKASRLDPIEALRYE